MKKFTRSVSLMLIIAMIMAAFTSSFIIPSAMAESSEIGTAKVINLTPYGLLTNELESPMNVPLNEKQSPNPPNFSWWLSGTGTDQVQTAYQILLTDDIDGAAVWDSGKVSSGKQSYVLYAGPALEPAHPYSWTVRVWDGNDAVSEYAKPAQFATGLSDDDWNTGGANWVYMENFPNGTRNTHFFYARADKPLSEDKTPVRALAYFCMEHDYELTVNGARVGLGQTWDYTGEQRYQGWDITDAVKLRENEITIALVCRWHQGGQGRAQSQPSLIGFVEIFYNDGSSQTIVTDGTWRMIRGTANNNLNTTQLPHVSHANGRNPGEGVFRDEYDATKETNVQGWNQPGHDTGGELWTSIDVRGLHPITTGATNQQFNHLIADLSHVKEEVVYPVSVEKLESGQTIVDFGIVIPAHLSVHFKNGENGRALTMRSGYQLQTTGVNAGRVDTSSSTIQSTTMTYIYTQKDGEQTYNEFDYLGLRYLEIPDCGEDFTVDDIWATVLTPEVPDGRDSTLVTSDTMLNDVFELMKRSALYSVQVGFVDTPTREQGQFLQDGINVGAALMTSWYEREKTRKALMQFLDSADRFWNTGADLGRYNAVYPNNDNKRDIPDYSLNMPLWVWEYYMQTGDIGTLARAYPYMKNTVDYAKRHIPEDGNQQGLVTMLTGGSGQYAYGIIDWPAVGRFGYDTTSTNSRSTINMLSVQLFDLMALAAEELGEDVDAAVFKADADTLRARINETMLVQDEDGFWKYTDGILQNGGRSTHFGQHSTSYALAFDVAPEEYRESLLDYIISMGMKQGPMTVDFLVEALCEGNRPEALLNLLTNPDDLGWADLLVNKNGTFTWEQWTVGQSQSHGWGAASVVQLYEYIAGVKVEEAGGKTVTINPLMAGVLETVDGKVVTESGPVKTSYSGTGTGFTMKIDVPANVKADVLLPIVEGGCFVEINDLPGEVSFTKDNQIISVGSGVREFVFVESENDEEFLNHGTQFGYPIGENAGYGRDPGTVIYYDGVLEVRNEDASGNVVGPALTHHKDSGVQILQEVATGLYFKDMNGNGKLDLYEDWRLPTEERAEYLALAIPAEKRLMLMVHSVGTTEEQLKDGRRFRWGTSVSGNPDAMAESNNRLQLWAEKDLDGFGVPVVTPSDPRHTGTVDTGNPEWDSGSSGLSKWPNHIGLGSTFSEEAIYDYSRITAREFRAIGLQMQIAPMIDTITDPRWSRASSCFSEDLKLNEDLNRAQIRGIQTSDESVANWGIDEGWGLTSVASMAKHWPGGGNGEFGFDAHTDDGKFGVFPNMNFEDYMETFARAAGFLPEDKGTTQQSAAFMPYFTISLDQDPSGLNVGNGLSHFMIQEMLRDRYDYDGFGVTDWMIHAQNGHGYNDAKGYTQNFRALEILKSGMDQIGGVFSGTTGVTLMNNVYAYGVEQLGKETMDKMTYISAKRCYRIMINLGLFESAYTDPQYAKEFVGSRELQETAQEDGHISAAVMLKNKNNLLPIASENNKPTVYIPQNANGTAVVSLDVAQRYYNIPDEIVHAVAERAVLTAEQKAAVAAKCDFALIKLTTPTPGNSGTPAQNLMYSPYTAQWQRQISLGYDWVHADGSMVMFGAGEVPDIMAGDYMTNRSIRNGLTHNGVPASLNIVNDTVAAMGGKPVVFALSMTNPMVVSDFEPYCDSIIIGGGISDVAIFEIISGNYEPNGLLTVNFPMNMETVELAYEDTGHDMVPYIDSQGNRYAFGFGLNWSGRISDERTDKYVVARDYPFSEKRGLEDYIGRAKKIDSNDYSDDINTSLTEALIAGEAVYASVNATQAEVNNAAEGLRSIIKDLPEIKVEVLWEHTDLVAGNVEIKASAVTFTPKNTIVITLTDEDGNKIAAAAADEAGNATLETGGLKNGQYMISAKSGEFTGVAFMVVGAPQNDFHVEYSGFVNLVEDCAANIPVTVDVSNPNGRDIIVGLFVNGELVVSAPVADGKTVIRVPAGVIMGSVDIRAWFDGDDVPATTGKTVPIKSLTATVWEPEIIVPGPEDATIVHFAEAITLIAKAEVTVNGNKVAGFAAENNELTVDAVTATGDVIVIKGVKYPGLFPSYSFTFTVTIP